MIRRSHNSHTTAAMSHSEHRAQRRSTPQRTPHGSTSLPLHAPAPPAPPVRVISRQGQKATVAVAALSVLSYISTGVVLVLSAHLLADNALGLPLRHGYVWGIVVGLVAACTCAVLDITTGAREARKEEQRIRTRVLRSLYEHTTMSIRDEADFQPAQIVTLMNDNAERLTEYRQAYLGSALAAFSIPFISIAYITCAIDWVLGVGMLLGFVMVPILFLAFMRYFRKRSSAFRRQRATLSSKYLDAIRNLTTVSLIGAGERIERDLRAEGERNRGAIMHILAGNQLVIIVVDFSISLFILCLSMWLLTVRIAAGAIALPGALSAVFLLVLIVAPVTTVAGFMYVGMGGIAAQKAIKRYLATHGHATGQVSGHTCVDAVSENAPQLRHGEEERQTTAPLAVRVDHVNYSYGEHHVLHDIHMYVPQGAKVAIIGPSGSGKSTLMNILRGLLPLQTGAAYLNECNLATERLSTIRQASASVAQRTWLFTGTIADNLRFARAEASDRDLWEALERAQLADDVRAMPQGLATDVGERGAFLSGGQAQRLALARAFLSQRTVLLLDEPTSHVDLESENLIIQAIKEIPSTITVVMVTHRQALLVAADTTYVMNAGTLQEAHND